MFGTEAWKTFLYRAWCISRSFSLDNTVQKKSKAAKLKKCFHFCLNSWPLISSMNKTADAVTSEKLSWGIRHNKNYWQTRIILLGKLAQNKEGEKKERKKENNTPSPPPPFSKTEVNFFQTWGRKARQSQTNKSKQPWNSSACWGSWEHNKLRWTSCDNEIRITD